MGLNLVHGSELGYWVLILILGLTFDPGYQIGFFVSNFILDFNLDLGSRIADKPKSDVPNYVH
jgi:hypothetical protein